VKTKEQCRVRAGDGKWYKELNLGDVVRKRDDPRRRELVVIDKFTADGHTRHFCTGDGNLIDEFRAQDNPEPNWSCGTDAKPYFRDGLVLVRTAAGEKVGSDEGVADPPEPAPAKQPVPKRRPAPHPPQEDWDIDKCDGGRQPEPRPAAGPQTAPKPDPKPAPPAEEDYEDGEDRNETGPPRRQERVRKVREPEPVSAKAPLVPQTEASRKEARAVVLDRENKEHICYVRTPFGLYGLGLPKAGFLAYLMDRDDYYGRKPGYDGWIYLRQKDLDRHFNKTLTRRVWNRLLDGLEEDGLVETKTLPIRGKPGKGLDRRMIRPRYDEILPVISWVNAKTCGLGETVDEDAIEAWVSREQAQGWATRLRKVMKRLGWDVARSGKKGGWARAFENLVGKKVAGKTVNPERVDKFLTDLESHVGDWEEIGLEAFDSAMKLCRVRVFGSMEFKLRQHRAAGVGDA
jgi:hypothetical protein